MGLFSGIKTTYKMSEAAVVVQNLLEHKAKIGLFSLDPGSYANKLVQAVWDEKPDVFNGKFGQRPHKMATAAIALARASQAMSANDDNRMVVLLCLGTILSEVETNGSLYPFTSMDGQLFSLAADVLTEAGQELGIEMES